MPESTKFTGFTGNQLKLLALVTMTLDHIGLSLLPGVRWLRILGRLAFPIFAWMIAEGCAHTRSRGRYLGNMAVLALACQIVYYLVGHSLYQSILVTFSLSIVVIWVVEAGLRRDVLLGMAMGAVALAAVWFLTDILPIVLRGTDYGVDYGFCGVMLPVLVYFGRDRWQKLALAALCLVLLGLRGGTVQWFALAALVPLALYNGKRGKYRLKYLFYVYYPAHLAVIWLISRFL